MRLVYIFWDQLSPDVSSIRQADKDKDVIILREVPEDYRYVKHHKLKLVLLMAAMRHFHKELAAQGYTVDYQPYDACESENHQGLLSHLDQAYKPEAILVTKPSDYYQHQALHTAKSQVNAPLKLLDDDRYIAHLEDFKAWFEKQKSPKMEFFYREVRKKTGYLMAGDAPEGGRWNYDQDNRKPPKKDMRLPERCSFDPDATTRGAMEAVEQHFPDHPGAVTHFRYATTRRQALQALRHFCTGCLANFGAYQDAMVTNEPFMYHSLLSGYINCGLLSPRAVCEEALAAYRKDDCISLSAIEGFIRQIIGWREYVRGIYHTLMPHYKQRNTLKAKRPLPDMFWTAETDMACLHQAFKSTLQHAYAHHIQRLMIIGNYALLAGLDVQEVCTWYHIVYVDAHEWVELPNTLGMALYGDNYVLATKPYAASGNYINKMSDYCKTCRYDPKKRTGEGACPYNALYWNFFLEHDKDLRGNHRLGLTYRNVDKLSDDDKKQLQQQARKHFDAVGISDAYQSG